MQGVQSHSCPRGDGRVAVCGCQGDVLPLPSPPLPAILPQCIYPSALQNGLTWWLLPASVLPGLAPCSWSLPVTGPWEAFLLNHSPFRIVDLGLMTGPEYRASAPAPFSRRH